MRPRCALRRPVAASALRTLLVIFTRTPATVSGSRWQQRWRSLDHTPEELHGAVGESANSTPQGTSPGSRGLSVAAPARAHLHLALAARVLAPARPARAPSGRRAVLPLPSQWSPGVPPSRAARTVVSGLTSPR